MIVFPLIRSVGFKGGDGIVEGRDLADVRPQSTVPHPLDDLSQLGTIGLDNEVDRQAVGGPRATGRIAAVRHGGRWFVNVASARAPQQRNLFPLGGRRTLSLERAAKPPLSSQ